MAAGTGMLTLDAPAGGLAFAGADAAAHPQALLAGPGVIAKIVQFHDLDSY